MAETIHVNGTTLNYELTGSGPLVVLIHTVTLDHRMFQPQMESLTEHYQVLRYDCRGYGKSAKPAKDEPFSHAEDLAALLDMLELEPASLIGVSMGGQIALEFELRYPGTVRSLVLSTPRLDGWEYTPEGAALRERAMTVAKTGGVEAAKVVWMAAPIFIEAMSVPAARGLLATMIAEYSGYHFKREVLNKTLDPPMVDRLEEIECPILLMVGENDWQDGKMMADRMMEELRDCERIDVPEVGHFANLEKPAEFNEIVVDFLLRTIID